MLLKGLSQVIGRPSNQKFVSSGYKEGMNHSIPPSR